MKILSISILISATMISGSIIYVGSCMNVENKEIICTKKQGLNTEEPVRALKQYFESEEGKNKATKYFRFTTPLWKEITSMNEVLVSADGQKFLVTFNRVPGASYKDQKIKTEIEFHLDEYGRLKNEMIGQIKTDK